MAAMREPVLNQELSLPDVRAATLDVAMLSSAIAERGALIVRGLIGDSDVAQLDEAFQTALAASTARFRRKPDWYTPFDDGTKALSVARQWAKEGDCGLLADSPAMMRLVLDTYRRAGVLDLVTAYLGEKPVLSSRKSTLRRAVGNRSYGDNWHQDGAFLGAGIRVVNLWLALTPCGERSPSVEIGLTRQTGIVPTGGDGAQLSWTVAPKQAAAASPRTIVPVCARGDALMFDQFCLHRTSKSASYSEDRHALETWFFAPSTYPVEYDPRPIQL